jgi:hypothetical protein
LGLYGRRGIIVPLSPKSAFAEGAFRHIVIVRSSFILTVLVVTSVGGCSFAVDGLPFDSTSTSADLSAAPDLGLPDQAAPPPPPDLQVVPPPGTLTLTAMPLTTSQAILLTPLGTRDWVHWGYAVATDIDRKVGGNAQIGDFAVVGSGTPVLYTDNIVGYNWSDGMPHLTSGGAQTSGIYLAKLNSGFRLTIPADANKRTLNVFVGGYHSTGRLTALLSDASAPDVSDDLHGNPTGKYTTQYTIDFAALTSGQSLLVTWVEESADVNGNVTLQAAALADAPPTPPTP